MRPSKPRLALLLAAAALLPLAPAEARPDRGDRGSYADGKGRGGERADRDAGRKGGGKEAGRVKAEADTKATADRRRATAEADAKARARGNITYTDTNTRTFTIETKRFRGAIAIAEAIAQAFRNRAAAERYDDLPSGAPTMRDLYREALADAKARARASGPEVYVSTTTDAYTTRAPGVLTAIAYSTSIALSYVGAPEYTPTENGFVRDAPSATAGGPGGTLHQRGEDGGGRCFLCRVRSGG